MATTPDDPTRLDASPKSAGSNPSGWLSSSGSIDHGRFDPGTLLGGRYRIVGKLGRGGMGEVYRADDLKLGQPVALKFLPPDVDRDPGRLMQLHNEVRLARQVSHPNVCRVYDIDEVDGHTFLSMEYVDGEDLAALLRRIGRFPEERGLEIARQVCAGLAAAHERGVIHRDFKPANVMLDASGKVRITDFGLAGVAGEALRAGTPAYMAPEQLSGGEVTARSDIYALGLVLYEIFTGQRASEGKNLAELIKKREQGGIAPPSTLVRDFNPEVEAAIVRCLQPDPAARPPSALAISATLPGGDPLAAALAAGETPSPEMVAAAGGSEALSGRSAFLAAAWIVASLVALVVLYDRVMMVNRIATPKTPDALLDRAAEALATLGYTDTPFATAYGMGFSLDFVQYVESHSSDPHRWDRLKTARTDGLYLWRRTSPRALLPFGNNPVTGQNPPLSVARMTVVLVDASGRLTEFVAVPDPVDADATVSPNFEAAFEAAGLSMAAFAPGTPRIVPPVFASDRRAWEERSPEHAGEPLRVEAAAQAGKLVYFVVAGPWSRSARAAPPDTPFFNRVLADIQALVMPGLILAAAILARRNVKLGRGDRRGALRAAAAVFGAYMVAWLLRRHVSPLGYDVDRMFASIGVAFFESAVLWLAYLGLEPYVRRYWPNSLIGWTRLLSGRWRDPRVGRDVMIGVSAGLAMTVIYAVHNVLPPLAGLPEPRPLAMEWNLLLGPREVLAYLPWRIANAVQGAMLCVIAVVALLIWLKKPWAAAIATIVCLTPVAINGMFSPGTPVLDVVLGTALMIVFIFTIVRFGLLATMAALATHFIFLRAPLTTELNSWRGPIGYWFLGTVALLGLGACYIARSSVARTVTRTVEQPQAV